MMKNEYHSLEEFTAQYDGTWAPSEGHWFGLDFLYKGREYRFHTGSMYADSKSDLPNGVEAAFGLYRKKESCQGDHCYQLLAEFSSMEEALSSRCIDGIRFGDIIVDEETELIGQD